MVFKFFAFFAGLFIKFTDFISSLFFKCSSEKISVEHQNELKSSISRKRSKRENQSPSQKEWTANSERLKSLIENDNLSEFLRWDVVRRTMFVSNNPYVLFELLHLKRKKDFETKWKKSLLESNIGCPIPFLIYPRSSGNLIHHNYHISIFEEQSGIDIKNLDLVFEFGGGYGSMCRLFYSAGFQGIYVMLDIEPFSNLQKFYLKSLNFPVYDEVKSLKEGTSGIFCTSKIEDIEDIVNTGKTESLFMATWSLSETPEAIRKQVIPALKYFKYHFLAFQGQFGEMDNKAYFENWKEYFETIKEWKLSEIRHLPGNYYLTGTSK